MLVVYDVYICSVLHIRWIFSVALAPSHHPNVHRDLRIISKILKQTSSAKFPEVKTVAQTAVGGFLFLRFICPAIVSPEGFEVVSTPLSPQARRPLILISKTLQNLANATTFKEQYMTPLNNLLEQNTAKLHSWFDQVTNLNPNDMQIPENQSAPAPDQLVNDLQEKDLVLLHRFFHTNKDTLAASIPLSPEGTGLSYDLVCQLNEVCAEMGEPPKLTPTIGSGGSGGSSGAGGGVDKDTKKNAFGTFGKFLGNIKKQIAGGCASYTVR